MKLRPSIFAIISLLLMLAPALRAQDGLRGALSREGAMVRGLQGFEQHLAAADFDNDQLPDGALLLPGGFTAGERSFRVELHITSGNGGIITFSTSECGLSISAFDVNRDGAPDIVIEKAFTHQRLQVYLNDGHGTFHKARLEDFTAPDPSAPTWQPSATQLSPPVYLPMTRGSEQAGLQKGCTVYLDEIHERRFSPDATRVQSHAGAASPSRGPPSPLAL